MAFNELVNAFLRHYFYSDKKIEGIERKKRLWDEYECLRDKYLQENLFTDFPELNNAVYNKAQRIIAGVRKANKALHV